MFPNSQALDGALINTFSFVFKGDILQKYQIHIYNNTTGSLVYIGDEVLVSGVFNDDVVTASIIAGSFTNGENYVWKVKLWDSQLNSVTSPGYFFKGRAIPSLSVPLIDNPHTSRVINLTSIYSQAENIPIRYHVWEIKDFSGNVVATTGKKYSANLAFSFDGLFSGETYTCNLTVTNQDDASVSTGDLPIVVQYNPPSIDYPPLVTIDNNTGAATISWENNVRSAGKTTGNYEFITNYPFQGTNSVNIISGNIVFDEIPGSIPIVDENDFSTIISITINNSKQGKIIELKGNDGLEYSVSLLNYGFYENKNSIQLFIKSIFHVLLPGQTASGAPEANTGYIWDDAAIYDDSQFWTETIPFEHQYLIVLSPDTTIIERMSG